MPQLSLGQYLSAINTEDSNIGRAFEKVVNAVNSLGKNLGADPVGKTQIPTPIQSIQVKGNLANNVITAPGELLHFTLQHSGETHKGTRYFAELATEPNFLQPHVIDLGASRTHTMTLPTLLDDGETTQKYYLRAYPQHPGSKPQKPTVLGGLTGATAIKMSGSTAATLLPSTGSGTAPTNGTRGNSGLGKTLTGTPAVVTKRSV